MLWRSLRVAATPYAWVVHLQLIRCSLDIIHYEWVAGYPDMQWDLSQVYPDMQICSRTVRWQWDESQVYPDMQWHAVRFVVVPWHDSEILYSYNDMRVRFIPGHFRLLLCPKPLVCRAFRFVVWKAFLFFLFPSTCGLPVYGWDLWLKCRNHLRWAQKGARRGQIPSHIAQVSSHWLWRAKARVMTWWNWVILPLTHFCLVFPVVDCANAGQIANPSYADINLQHEWLAAVIKEYQWLTDVKFLEFWTFNVELELQSFFAWFQNRGV